jgi:hypothetical protein
MNFCFHWCFSSHWCVWYSALCFDIRFIDSHTTCHCSCNGRFSCEWFHFFLIKCLFIYFVYDFFGKCIMWILLSDVLVAGYRRKLLQWYRLCSSCLEWRHSCILFLGLGCPWYKVLLLFTWLRFWRSSTRPSFKD